ncbi:cysteine peptidase family C39 domain-containing protein, partial [Flavobacterium collinsii]|uniref:cysteine peptidase family C39 domain-containing protein n=1 Tax=Flavobacterium collinsii TaxID=1114861 RepID=UPI001FEBF94D
MKKFTNYKQADYKDCGPTCLKIIAKHYGKTINIQELRDISETTREGSNLLFLSDAAEKIGFRTLGVKLNLERLEEAPLPCVLHWNKNHYVVLYKIKKKTYYISDPAFGLIEYNNEDFIKFWIGNNANESTQEGIALLIEATPKFFQS